ncbi:MAG: polyprenyl synthetase family protein [Gemmatimonadota bacterium]|nr:polyprenyl synthetase family protein [Gemmatimonadota bacterium]
MTDPSAEFAADRAAVDAALAALVRDEAATLSGPVGDAIRYSLEGGGKRLRGVLFLAAYRAAGGAVDAAPLAAAIEVVHAYSLVHDDLPCMDDDDMRRGRPTVHRVYGVAVATAAGVAMVPLAARAASRAAARLGLPIAVQRRIVAELMRASGAGGMVGGQLLDLEGEGRSQTLDELERIHRAKTGALIAASVTLGGLAAGASPDSLDALARFGASTGLAFQIADDVLDVTATTDQLGKTAGKDLAYGKSTYPALLGVDGAVARADALVADGCAALERAGLLTPGLDRLARFIITRRS